MKRFELIRTNICLKDVDRGESRTSTILCFYDLRQLLVEGHLEDDIVAHGPPIPKMVLVPASDDEVDLHW